MNRDKFIEIFGLLNICLNLFPERGDAGFELLNDFSVFCQ